MKVVLIGCLSLLWFLSAGASERPNIILLMGDDHGWDEVGYNGHPYLKTPNLDDMSANGLRLDNFYSAHPSCSPTRGSVLTGRHPIRYGVFAPGWSIRPEEITIAHLLGNAGYRCAHFGKWHLGPVKASSPTNPRAMGFEYCLSHDNFFEMSPFLSTNGGPPEQFLGEGSEVLVNQAIKYLKLAKRGRRPFFVVIWYGSPHEPYSGSAEDLALYRDVPSRFNDHVFRLTSNETGQQVTRPLGDVLQERYAEITAMDRSIGTLRDWLAKNGLRDNTLIWYCGDNGSHTDGSVTSPFRGHKGTVYEGGVRVPCVVEWPARLTVQRTTDTNAVTSDILPTICELLELSLPDRPTDGESILSLFDNDNFVRTRPICFWEFNFHGDLLNGLAPYIDPELQKGTTPLVKEMRGRYTRDFSNLHIPTTDDRFLVGSRAILDNQYKLVVDGSGPDELQLFDLHNDPGEQHDLSRKMPERSDKLYHELQNWQVGVLQSLTGADY